jgi:NADPH:quinone reductase-like Zn-dependent oxidoreductase
MRGDPGIARLMTADAGLRRPKAPVIGIDVAGVVTATGPDTGGLRPGDEVLGFAPGSFAEYVTAKADHLVPKPAGLTFAEAAALPMAATTALRGITGVAKVRAGQRVLINGAAGGIGTFAVQIAAALGAEVTGVCSTRNVDLVRSLGAAHVVDYTAGDFTGRRGRYDVILDNVGSQPLRRLRRALAPDGILVLNFGGSPGHLIGAVGPMLRAVAVNVVVRQRLRVLQTAMDQEELRAVTGLVEAGKLRPVLDRDYPLAEVADGIRYMEQGHARGKATVTVA